MRVPCCTAKDMGVTRRTDAPNKNTHFVNARRNHSWKLGVRCLTGT